MKELWIWDDEVTDSGQSRSTFMEYQAAEKLSSYRLMGWRA